MEDRALRLSLHLLLLLFLVSASACGTFATRSTGSQTPELGYFFGFPLFASIPHDVDLIIGRGDSCKSLGLESVGGVVSLPVDLLIEIVLLPIDLLSGAFGRSRRPATAHHDAAADDRCWRQETWPDPRDGRS